MEYVCVRERKRKRREAGLDVCCSEEPLIYCLFTFVKIRIQTHKHTHTHSIALIVSQWNSVLKQND